MATPKQSSALQTIFAFFLGLMVTAFIGVGAYTFYPTPDRTFFAQFQDLSRREAAIRDARPPEALTDQDREALRGLRLERETLVDAQRAAREPWGRTMSILLVAFATLSMGISLIRADRLLVISNGLLLGGVFTMVHGVGTIIVTDPTTARFLVLTVALAITLGLGYLRFARQRIAAPSSGTPGPAASEGLAALDQRIHDLEERLNQAASVLGQTPDR